MIFEKFFYNGTKYYLHWGQCYKITNKKNIRVTYNEYYNTYKKALEE